MTQVDFYVLLPLIILVAWACTLLLVDLFIPKERKWVTAMLAAFGIALTLGFTISQMGGDAVGFCSTDPDTHIAHCMIALDGFSIFVNALLLVSGLQTYRLFHLRMNVRIFFDQLIEYGYSSTGRVNILLLKLLFNIL